MPAKVTGSSSHKVSRARQVELGRRMIDDLHELLALRGHEVSAISDGETRGFEVDGVTVAFVPSFTEASPEAVVLTLEMSGEPADGVAVLDLLERRVHGSRRGRPRLGSRVLPQARDQVRAGAVALSRRPASSRAFRRSWGRQRAGKSR